MATRIAAANAGFTTASTWQTSDATAQLITGSTSGAVTTSYQTSSTFTPGAITIDGIAVWINTRPGSSGTMTVALDLATVDVAGTVVTIDIADIPAGGNCWVLFKFAAPVLLVVATAYGVKIKSSSNSLVTCLVSAGTNWNRMLRTTDTGAPAAADGLYILGEKTGSGAQTARTVTMDDAAAGATVYGPIDVSAGGALTYGVTGSVAYYLKIAGNFNVRAGGTLNMGTVGSAMPSTSSGVLEFNCGTNIQYGLIIKNGGTFVGQGNPITVKAKLNADASASATSLTTDVSTGWLNGDEIGIAATTRTAAQSEKKSLTAGASGTTLTIAALTNAHGGNSSTGVQADLINLTRNVKVRGVSASLQAYVLIQDGATIDLDYVEIYQMGNGTTGTDGLEINTHSSTSDVNMQNCALHDFALLGFFNIDPTTTLNCAIYLNHNVIYNLVSYLLNIADRVQGSGSISLLDTVAIKCTGAFLTSAVTIAYAEIICDGLVCNGSADGGIILSGAAGILGTFKNVTAYGNADAFTTAAIAIGNVYGDKNTDVQNLVAWRNGASGLLFGSNGGLIVGVHILGTNTLFGNAVAGLISSGVLIDCSIYGVVANAGVTLTQPVGWEIGETAGGAQQNFTRFYVYNSTFGATQTHATSDLDFTVGSGTKYLDITLVNCLLASSVEFTGNIPRGSRIKYQRRDQTTQLHKSVGLDATVSLDTTAGMFDVSPSVRIAPAHATIKTEVPVRKAEVPNGGTKTVSVKVRCSVVGDGAAYNGARPRLIQKAQPGAGSTADVVLATATGASDGAFETLSNTIAAVTDDCVITFVVDCDGTTGWVNVDTLTIT